MVLYVRAKEVDFGDEVWLRLDGSDIEVVEEFEPDPFSRITNICKGRVFEVGIYRFRVIGDIAYTRRL